MTHDELIAKINEECETTWEDATGNVPMSPQALRAVVELHKPFDSEKYGYNHCEACEKNGLGYKSYPCPTIQAIEEILK